MTNEIANGFYCTIAKGYIRSSPFLVSDISPRKAQILFFAPNKLLQFNKSHKNYISATYSASSFIAKNLISINALYF